MKDAGIIMNYTVEYVELENGKKPFEEFVLSLPIKESLSKYLEDGIFELRTAFARRIARSVYSERGKNYPDTWFYQENGENTTKGD